MIGKFQLPEAASLGEDDIREALAWKAGQLRDLADADAYYIGRNRLPAKEGRRKVPVPYGRKLIKSVLGFMFKEGCITYAFPDDWGAYKAVIEDIMALNDEETENIRLALDQAKYGSAFEALYVDNPEASPQFFRLPASQVIPVYSYDIRPRMWAAINHYSTRRHAPATGSDQIVEVYYAGRIERYALRGRELEKTGELAHHFGEVPIIEYRNNHEGLGDIEAVEALIDAHDEIMGNALDEDSKFADAILMLKNASLDREDVEKLIDARLLELDDDGQAGYLTKPDRYAGREVLRKVVEGLIYSMSGIPNLDDKDALAAQSGESLKYLYATFEIMVAGDKQSGFTDGLRQRLRLINNYLCWLGRSSVSSVAKVDIRWQRNLPAEGTVLIDNVVKTSGIVSRRTQIEGLHKAGLVGDVDGEMERLAEEREETAAELAGEVETAYNGQAAL